MSVGTRREGPTRRGRPGRGGRRASFPLAAGGLGADVGEQSVTSSARPLTHHDLGGGPSRPPGTGQKAALLMSTPPAFEFQLFGGPILRKGGAHVRLSPQAQRLLGLIAASGSEGIRRDRLLDLLWEGGEAAMLRPRLAQALYVMRKGFAPDDPVLEVDDRLVLDSRTVRSDLTTFEMALNQRDFDTAFGLFQKGFLRGFSKGLSEDAEAWVKERGEELREGMADMTGGDIVSSFIARDFQRVVATASIRKHLAAPSFANEYSLVLGLLNQGRVREAQCLAQGLRGAEGMPASADHGEGLDSLIMLTNRAYVAEALSISPRVSVPPRVSAFWREFVVSIARMVLAPTAPNDLQSRCIVVASEPDCRGQLFMGLLLQFLAALGRPLLNLDEASVLRDRAFDGRSNPTGTPFEGLAPASIGANPFVCFSLQARRLLRSPDSVSRALSIARSQSPGAVFLCLDDSSDRKPSVAASVGSVLDILTVRLPAPTEEEVLAFLAPSGNSGDTGSHAAIAALCGGYIPFLESSTVLKSQTGTPGWAPLSSVIARLLDSIDPLDQKVLTTTALLDGPADPGLVARACGVTLESLNEPLMRLEARGLLLWCAGSIRLRASAIRDWLFAGTELRPQVLAASVAANLEGLPIAPSVKLDSWRLAGDRDKIFEWARHSASTAKACGSLEGQISAWEAAVNSAEVGTPRQASLKELCQVLARGRRWEALVPLARRAAEEALGSAELSEWISFRALLAEAWAHSHPSRISQAIAELEELLSLAEGLEPAERAAECVDQLVHLYHRLGELGQMTRLLGRARALVANTDCHRSAARLHGTLAMESFFGDFVEGEAQAAKAVSAAEQTGDPNLLLIALNRQLATELARGRLETISGKRLQLRALELARRSEDYLQRLHTLINLAVWETDCGRFENAAIQFESLIGQVHGLADPRIEVLLHTNAGIARIKAHDFSGAKRHLTAAEAMFQAWSSAEVQAQVTAGLGILALEEGRIGEAKKIAEDKVLSCGDVLSDPTIVALFRSTLLRRLGRKEKAAAVLVASAEGTKHRYPVHYLALVYQRLLWSRNPRCSPDEEDLRNAIAKCNELGLTEWLRKFQGL